jgi:Bax protein
LLSKIKWQRWLDKAWFYTKVLFALCIISGVAFTWGSFYPNATAISKVNSELDKYYVNKIKEMDLQEPEFTYINDIQFVRSMHKCIDYINFTTPKHLRVPYEMILGQAALESGWGTSRFAKEANNLLGIKTWDEKVPYILPMGIEKWPGWGVRVFASKCDSVKEYIRLLNEHSAYEDFRKLRLKTNDPIKLIKTLDKFSITTDYHKRVIRVINEIRKLEE